MQYDEIGISGLSYISFVVYGKSKLLIGFDSFGYLKVNLSGSSSFEYYGKDKLLLLVGSISFAY